MKRFVVVATYNEAANLPDLLAAIGQAVPEAGIIVVDDSSPDGSPELLRRAAAENPALTPVIRAVKDGYGGAMLCGFQKALELGAEQVATLDADFSHDPKALPDLFAALDGAEVALGSRYYQGVRVLNWHPSRLLLSLFANRYVNTILRLGVDDATSGYRAYRREALQTVIDQGIRSRGYSFLVEVLYGLKVKGFSVCEVPIIYNERREGESKMSRGVIMEAVFRPWKLRWTVRR